MSLMVDISGLDDRECHLQCRWQRATEYVYCPILRLHERNHTCRTGNDNECPSKTLVEIGKLQ